jgi:hypothetical protein
VSNYSEYPCCSFAFNCSNCESFSRRFNAFFGYTFFCGAPRVELFFIFTYYFSIYSLIPSPSYPAISAASYLTSFFACFLEIYNNFPLNEDISRAPTTSITNINDFYWGKSSRFDIALASILLNSIISRNFSRTCFLCWVSNGNFYKPSITSLLNCFPVRKSIFSMASAHSKPLSNTLGCFSSTRLFKILINFPTVNA